MTTALRFGPCSFMRTVKRCWHARSPFACMLAHSLLPCAPQLDEEDKYSSVIRQPQMPAIAPQPATAGIPMPPSRSRVVQQQPGASAPRAWGNAGAGVAVLVAGRHPPPPPPPQGPHPAAGLGMQQPPPPPRPAVPAAAPAAGAADMDPLRRETNKVRGCVKCGTCRNNSSPSLFPCTCCSCLPMHMLQQQSAAACHVVHCGW